jgi:hypothetical protein
LCFPALAPEKKLKKRGSEITSWLEKKKMQILRLTTPNLHPSDEDLSPGTPE